MQYKVRIVETDDRGNPLKDENGNPVITYEDYSLDDLMKIASGRDASNGFGLDEKNGMSPRQRLLSDEFGVYDENGKRIDNKGLENVFLTAMRGKESGETKTERPPIPTLSDVGHGIASWTVENPFSKQLEALKLRREKEGSTPELEAQIAQTEGWRKDFEDNILPDMVRNNGFSWQKPVEAAGEFLDVVDAITTLIPGGRILKGGASLLGKGGKGVAGLAAKKGVKPVEKAGQKISDVLQKVPNNATSLGADIGQETLLETAHGAIQAPEGEGFTRGLEQGAIAGLLTAGTHGLGGKFIRQGEEMNKDIKRELNLLRKQGVDVPEFAPFKNKGEAVLTPEQLERRRMSVIGRMNFDPAMRQTISSEELNKMIKETNAKMQRWNEAKAPWEATRQFEEGLNSTLPISDWEKSVRDRLPAPDKNGNFRLNDVLPVLLEKIQTSRPSLIGAPGTWDLGTDADWVLARKISLEKGISKPRFNRPITLPSRRVYDPKEPTWEGGLKTLQTLDRLGQMKYHPNPLGVQSGKQGMFRSAVAPFVTMTEKRNLPVESWNDLVKRIESNAALDVGRNMIVGPYAEDTWDWPAIQEEATEGAKNVAKQTFNDVALPAAKEIGTAIGEGAKEGFKGKKKKEDR